MKVRTFFGSLFASSILLLTSCKQNVLINKAVFVNDEVEKIGLWKFVEESLIDWTFGVWLVFDLIIALLIWQHGFRLLEWFRNKPMSTKVVAILTCLSLLFIVGCIPQELNSQQYGGWFALPVALAIGSTVVVIWSLVQRYRHRLSKNERPAMPDSYRRQRNLVLLAKVMFWIWCCGWVIYFVAIGIAKQPHVGAEVLLRSAVASLDLFWMDIDSNILDAIKGHDVLKGMVVCASFAAVICLATLILSLVLSRLMAYLHIRHVAIDNQRCHLYVFFGLNEPSKLLAKDIYNRDQQSVIVFVENSLVGEAEQDEDKTDGWKNIVSMLTHRRKTFIDAAEDERRALAIASCDICSLDKDTTNVWGNIGLETIRDLLQRLSRVSDAELHVFFLSEDRDSNVRSTAILAKDDMINSPSYQTIIYCHARRNGVNKVIEDLGIDEDKRTEVRILDSSHLALEHLKQKATNHPVNFVTVRSLEESNPGAVSSEFVSLVMGFGETGQEAVNFLYEYGAFLHSDASANDSRRSPFSCHVVDSEMMTLEGSFVAGIPAVGGLIRFHSCDYRSIDFYTKVLDPIVEKLNYVVVAIGDDEQNMTAAVEILRQVRKKRENLDNFCIYVRAYEKGTFKHLNEIAKHYNLRLSEDGKTPVEKIVLFGQNDNIYTYDLIVKDKYQEDGKKYYEAYRSLQIDPKNDEGDWDKRRRDTMTSKTGTKWEHMSKIRRKENQDRSNALHAHTKMMLLEKTVGKDKVNDFAIKALSGRVGKEAAIDYPKLEGQEKTLMLNLAMTEHLRWNAAHEMLGYVNNTKGHGCDERTRQHNCLKPWQDLDNESRNAGYPVDFKLFDFGVVETTFKLYLIENKIDK